jgi:hypothetical protein
VKLRGTRRFTDWAEVSATASGRVGGQPDAMRRLLLRDLTEVCEQSRVSKGEYGVRVSPVAGRGSSDGLFDGRSCVGGRVTAFCSRRVQADATKGL